MEVQAAGGIISAALRKDPFYLFHTLSSLFRWSGAETRSWLSHSYLPLKKLLLIYSSFHSRSKRLLQRWLDCMFSSCIPTFLHLALPPTNPLLFRSTHWNHALPLVCLRHSSLFPLPSSILCFIC
jgi:hypothetical protein